MPLIVLEGLDGAGKSTQIGLLQGMLARRGVPHRYLHFPRFDAPVYGELIGRFLRGECGALDQVDPYLVALLFAGDRADAGPMLRGWLEEGIFVLLDRYVYSNIAFQTAKLSGEQQRAELREWIRCTEYDRFDIPKPDLSLFLDVPLAFVEQKLSAVREGDDRAYLHGRDDIHESSLAFQREVRNAYLEAGANDPAFHRIDCALEDGAMASAETIFNRIERHIEPLLP